MVRVLGIGRLLGSRISVGSGALNVLGNEWDGLALDFLTDTYARRVSPGAERLLSSGPSTLETAIGMDFTDNTYAIGA